MSRMWYVIPPEKVGKVPCMWTKGCANAATHVDEFTEKTICPVCYEEQLWSGKKKTDVTSSAVERALASIEKAKNKKAKVVLKSYADEATKAAKAVNGRKDQVKRNGTKPKAEVGRKRAGGRAE